MDKLDLKLNRVLDLTDEIIEREIEIEHIFDVTAAELVALRAVADAARHACAAGRDASRHPTLRLHDAHKLLADALDVLDKNVSREIMEG